MIHFSERYNITKLIPFNNLKYKIRESRRAIPRKRIKATIEFLCIQRSQTISSTLFKYNICLLQ